MNSLNYWATRCRLQVLTNSIPITPFKNYIRANQIDTDYYYSSVPGSAQRDIKAALRVRRAILTLTEKHGSLAPADFRKLYVTTLVGVPNDAKRVGIQNDLHYQGYAPVASNDTKNAESNRDQYVRDHPNAAGKLL